jgi:uncharacterized protein (DUF58 family)
MPRSFVLSLGAYVLILLGLVSLRGEFILLSLPLVVYLLAGYLFAPQHIDLTIERTLDSERVPVDWPVVVTLKITNNGRRLEELHLVDRISASLSVQKGSSIRIMSLGSGKSATWTYTLRGPRGYYAFQNVDVEVFEHFGLARRETTIHTSGKLFILPPVIRLRKIPIRTRRTRVYAGTIPARLGGPGVDFFGVREYQSGDAPRLINWRASARHTHSLFTNEYEQERVADVGIVLDGRIKTNILGQDHSIYEYSILACAALADALLSQGNRVGLLNYGRYLQWTFPGYGKIQRERIIQALANAETGGSSVFSGLEHLPTRLFPAQSQIILVSPLDTEDDAVLLQLRAQGYQVMVISPDPVNFELGILPVDRPVELAYRLVRLERNLMIKKLRRGGIQFLDWDVSQPFDRVIERRLGRPPAYWRNIGVRL